MGTHGISWDKSHILRKSRSVDPDVNVFLKF